MNRRITKAMATEAAEKMAAKLFDKKIDDAVKKKRDYMDILVKKYVPNPVLSVLKEYPNYFYGRYYSQVYVVGAVYVGKIETSIMLPSREHAITIDIKEKDELISLYNQQKTMERNKVEFYNAMVYRLYCELKNEKNVKKYLPEALDYIDLPVTVQPPALTLESYVDIRRMLKMVSHENKD